MELVLTEIARERRQHQGALCCALRQPNFTSFFLNTSTNLNR